MRVLHVVPSFYPAVGYGGPIYSVLKLCLGLTELGCEVKVVTTDANGNSRLTAEQKNDSLLGPLKIDFSRRIGKGMLAPSLAGRVLTESRWADVIHLTAVYNFATWPTLLAARMNNKPLVWSPRGTLQRWSGSRRLWHKTAWESLCRAVMPQQLTLHCTSEVEAKESASRLGCPRTFVAPNGIDIPPLPAAPPSNGVLKLLFVGRLDAKKGIENLIASTSQFAALGIDRWHLKIVGNGDRSYVDELRRHASAAGQSDHVEFCGHYSGEKKYEAYSESDLVVVPSHTENFGIVVAEALAHSRPVVVSRGTPWSEVEARNCGRWVENDPASLAEAIRDVGTRDRVAMGKLGRAWMIEAFSWEEQTRRMLGLYQQVLST